MAMDADKLGNDLAEIVDLSKFTEDQRDLVRNQWKAIAQVIVDHIREHAIVRVSEKQSVALLEDGEPQPVEEPVSDTTLYVKMPDGEGGYTEHGVSGEILSPNEGHKLTGKIE